MWVWTAWRTYAAKSTVEIYGADNASSSVDGDVTVFADYADSSDTTTRLYDTINLDREEPSGTMCLNGGAAATNKLTVTVNSSIDGATHMRFLTLKDDEWLWTSWRGYAASASVTIYGSDGAKVVIADYMDDAGNVFRSPSAYIKLDRVAPVGTMRLDGGATITNKLTVAVSSAVTGATQMRFLTLKDGLWVSTGWRVYAAASTAPIYPPDGRRSVLAEYMDDAGNVFRSPAGYITLDSTGPAVTASSSTTHPVPGTWYATSAAVVKWTPPSDVSGLVGYSFTIDKSAHTVPDMTVDSTPSGPTAAYSGLSDGVWVFHVRALDKAGNWGAPLHREIRVDTGAPATQARGAGDSWHSRPVDLRFSATDAGCGVQATQYRLDGDAGWTDGTSVTVPAPFTGGRVTRTVYYRSVDYMGHWEAEKSCAVKLDTTDTTAPTILGKFRKRTVKRGRTAAIPIRVADAWPSNGTVRVMVFIRRSKTKLVQKVSFANVRTGSTRSLRFRCRLPVGYYHYDVRVSDSAGHSTMAAGAWFWVVR